MLTSYGNALPGAFNLMAAAIGVSTQELDDMMRKGQVISAEVLPKFAAMLNTVTEGAHFDSLQMSLNRLKNAWYDFVESSNAENIFDKLVKQATAFVQYISDNISRIASAVKGLVTGILSYKLFDYLKRKGAEYVAAQEANYKKLMAEHKKYVNYIQSHSQLGGVGGKVPSMKFDQSVGGALGGMAYSTRIVSPEDTRAIIQYNNNLIETARLKQRISGIPLMTDAEIARIRRYNAQLATTVRSTTTMGASIKTGVKSIGTMISGVIASIGSALASLGITAIISAIIAGITFLIDKTKKEREEIERINNILTDYETKVEITNKAQAEGEEKLRAQLRYIRDASNDEKARLKVLDEMNKTMGLIGENAYNKDALDKTKKAYNDIADTVERWCQLTKLQAKLQVQATEGAEAEAEYNRLSLELIKWKNIRDSKTEIVGRDDYGNPVYRNKTWFNGGQNAVKKVQQIEAEMQKYQTIINKSSWAVDELIGQIAELNTVMSGKNNGGGGGGNNESSIRKIYKNYNKELQELKNLLNEGVITQEEYNTAFNELSVKFWRQAAATGKYSLEDITKKVDNGRSLHTLEKWYYNLAEDAKKGAGEILYDLVTTALEESAELAIKKAQEVLDNEMDKYINSLDSVLDARQEIINGAFPRLEERDATFDYSKSAADILSETFSGAENYADALRAFIEKYKEFVEEDELIAEAVANATKELGRMNAELPDLENKMKIAKVKEDLDEMKNSMYDLTYGGIKNMATSLDRMVKSAESIRDTFDNADASGWEKFMVIFNGIAQVIDTVYGVYDSLRQIAKLTSNMEDAELVLINLQNEALQQQLLLRQKIEDIKREGIVNTGEQAAADYASTMAANANASAKAKEAIANATDGGAKMPFPYNIIAIGAGVAAVLAALASMSKFAEGGIIGGNSYSGDRQLARVNSGEMILNKHQQATLFNAINSGKLGGSGNVQFKIRGTDLIGVMENEMSRRRG